MNHACRLCWIRPWIGRRSKFGAFKALLTELSIKDPQSFRNFFNMDKEAFEGLRTCLSQACVRRNTLYL